MSWNDVEKEGNGGTQEKIPYCKLEPGTTVIRIVDEEPYSFWSHWFNKQRTSVTCPGKGCPVCAVVAEQRKDKNMEKKYTTSQRHAIRVWNYKEDRMEVLVQGKSFFSQLLDLHREVGDLTTYDLKIIRKGSGTDTNYTIIPAPPKEFEHADKVTEVNMEEMFKAPDTEVIVQLMEGKTWQEIFPKDEE